MQSMKQTTRMPRRINRIGALPRRTPYGRRKPFRVTTTPGANMDVNPEAAQGKIGREKPWILLTK